jgi:hypothetical protein
VSNENRKRKLQFLYKHPQPHRPSVNQLAYRFPKTLGTMLLTSDPYGAEIFEDSVFVGKTPATLKLKPGRHYITSFHEGL